jgi:Pentapeptide repeats (8 copies)
MSDEQMKHSKLLEKLDEIGVLKKLTEADKWKLLEKIDELRVVEKWEDGTILDKLEQVDERVYLAILIAVLLGLIFIYAFFIPILVSIAFIVFSIISMLFVWLVPKWQIKKVKDATPQEVPANNKPADITSEILEIGDATKAPTETKPASLKSNELFTLENEARKTMAQIIGGLFVIVGFIFTGANLWITTREAEKGRALTQENLVMTTKGQSAERFTKVTTQLGDKDFAVRLGGIYGLERHYKEYPDDYWTIMEILTAFVREKSPHIMEGAKTEATTQSESKPNAVTPSPSPSLTDIQAIVNVIRRRKVPEGQSEGTLDFRRARLQEADFNRADLTNANFYGSDLRNALFRKAVLKDTWLVRADLRFARFSYSDTKEGEGADFSGANLEKANLRGTDLSKVKNLTWEQIDSAIIDEDTKLPPEFEEKKQKRLNKLHEQERQEKLKQQREQEKSASSPTPKP